MSDERAKLEPGTFSPDIPFKVVVRPHSDSSELPTPEQAPKAADETSAPDDQGEGDDFELSLEDIEAAYLKALETADLADSMLQSSFEAAAVTAIEDEAEVTSELPVELPIPESNSEQAAEHPSMVQAASEEVPPIQTESEPEPEPEPQSAWVAVESRVEADSESDELEEPAVSATQVVEAMLFVGGAPLPTKKFLDVLGGAHSAEQVDALLESINRRYLSQRRPYEVRLVEGGYQLQLSPEFETVRGRTYGHGPKEVKLAQDALEILAFVAYQQPVGRAAIEETGKINVPGLLRQLLRRELIVVDRSDAEAGEQYRTTSRFLELFGLTSLDDLPQAGTFNFK